MAGNIGAQGAAAKMAPEQSWRPSICGQRSCQWPHACQPASSSPWLRFVTLLLQVLMPLVMKTAPGPELPGQSPAAQSPVPSYKTDVHGETRWIGCRLADLP